LDIHCDQGHAGKVANSSVWSEIWHSRWSSFSPILPIVFETLQQQGDFDVTNLRYIGSRRCSHVRRALAQEQTDSCARSNICSLDRKHALGAKASVPQIGIAISLPGQDNFEQKNKVFLSQEQMARDARRRGSGRHGGFGSSSRGGGGRRDPWTSNRGASSGQRREGSAWGVGSPLLGGPPVSADDDAADYDDDIFGAKISRKTTNAPVSAPGELEHAPSRAAAAVAAPASAFPVSDAAAASVVAGGAVQSGQGVIVNTQSNSEAYNTGAAQPGNNAAYTVSPMHAGMHEAWLQAAPGEAGIHGSAEPERPVESSKPWGQSAVAPLRQTFPEDQQAAVSQRPPHQASKLSGLGAMEGSVPTAMESPGSSEANGKLQRKQRGWDRANVEPLTTSAEPSYAPAPQAQALQAGASHVARPSPQSPGLLAPSVQAPLVDASQVALLTSQPPSSQWGCEKEPSAIRAATPATQAPWLQAPGPQALHETMHAAPQRAEAPSLLQPAPRALGVRAWHAEAVHSVAPAAQPPRSRWDIEVEAPPSTARAEPPPSTQRPHGPPSHTALPGERAEQANHGDIARHFHEVVNELRADFREKADASRKLDIWQEKQKEQLDAAVEVANAADRRARSGGERLEQVQDAVGKIWERLQVLEVRLDGLEALLCLHLSFLARELS
jgi:hypothetical protein